MSNAAQEAAYAAKEAACARAVTGLNRMAADGGFTLSGRPVAQDGRDFYFLDTGGDDTPEPMEVVTAPMRVPDMDMVAAMDARHWFIAVWCGRARVLPSFEGEAR